MAVTQIGLRRITFALRGGVPECLRLLRHPAELGPGRPFATQWARRRRAAPIQRVVRELEAEVRPPVVLRPDPEAAARHRAQPPGEG